jgi:hypothetical protein
MQQELANSSFELEPSNENFVQIRTEPKRNNSSSNLKSISNQNAPNQKRKSPTGKVKTSLFNSNNKEEEQKTEYKSIKELISKLTTPFYIYAISQKGSRTLQRLLDKIQNEEIDLMLDQLKNNFEDLMTDTYGNYFCQKLFQSCSSEQRLFILKHLGKNFYNISINSSGTHALQSLIDIINLKDEEELIKVAVKDNIIAMSLVIN